jgi:hypothetical protein
MRDSVKQLDLDGRVSRTRVQTPASEEADYNNPEEFALML